MTSVLMVEDNQNLLNYYKKVIEGAGIEVETASTGAEGLDRFTRTMPDVVALDLVLPDREGLELMRDCLAMKPQTKVVVITAHGNIQTAVESMRQGAFEFLPKPFGDNQLLAAVDRAANAARRNGNGSANGNGHQAYVPTRPQPAQIDQTRVSALPGLIGQSSVMQELYRRCRAVATSDVPVFLVGPEGSGRAEVARAIHKTHPQPRRPFVELPAAVLSPRQQMEILAPDDDTDLLKKMENGTIHISEPAALSAAAQQVLLQLLRRYEESEAGLSRGPRLICSADGDPFEAVTRGRLREDLFHRLYVAPITVPALAERGEDVIATANELLRTLDTRVDGPLVGLSPDVAAFFRRYHWPGNVRQLNNLIRSAVVQNEGPLLTMEMLPPEMIENEGSEENASLGVSSLVGKSLAEIERLVIEATIEAEGGSLPKAARVLDVSPSTLYRKREAWEGVDV